MAGPELRPQSCRVVSLAPAFAVWALAGLIEPHERPGETVAAHLPSDLHLVAATTAECR
ncbi:MAG TPA: hypothetical protein VHX68_12925 [Planctomycetaceae bacterium]|nr:hypothetical protein [Planctomycetaceae bacterium]